MLSAILTSKLRRVCCCFLIYNRVIWEITNQMQTLRKMTLHLKIFLER